MREVVQTLYETEGVKGFYRGLSPTLARTFIINSVRLPAFEYLNDRYCYNVSKAD